jgi:hypothetical protein
MDLDDVLRVLGLDEDTVWSVSFRLEPGNETFVVECVDGSAQTFRMTPDGPVR